MTVVEFAEYARWAFLAMLIACIGILIGRTVKIRIVRAMPSKPGKPAPFCEDCKWFKPKPPGTGYSDQCVHPTVYLSEPHEDVLVRREFMNKKKDTLAPSCGLGRKARSFCGPQGKLFELRPLEKGDE